MTITTHLNPDDLTIEDGGMFRSFDIEPDDEQENGIFFRFNSWDDTTEHTDFKKFEGKKIKLTIEIVED